MQKKMCKKCGLLNKPEVSFCTHCGNKIDIPSQYTLLKQCPVCGKYVLNDAIFCPKCGKSFSKEEKQEPSSFSTPSIVCPFCRSKQKPTAKFCTQCGVNLTTTVKEPNVLICSNCQTTNPPNAHFCKYCGTKFEFQQKLLVYSQGESKPITSIEQIFEKKVEPAFKIVKCLNCGSSNHPDGYYCIQCGVQLRKKNILCSICGQKIGEDKSCPSCGRKLVFFEKVESDLHRFLPVEKAQFLNDLADSISQSGYFFDINLLKKEMLKYLSFYPTILFLMSSDCSIEYLNSFKIGLEARDTPEIKLEKIVNNFEVFTNLLDERIDFFAIATFAYFFERKKENKLSPATYEQLNFLLDKALIAIETDISSCSQGKKEFLALQYKKLVLLLLKTLVLLEKERKKVEKIISRLLVALAMNLKDSNTSNDPGLAEISEKFYAFSIFFSEDSIKEHISGKIDLDNFLLLLQELKNEILYIKEEEDIVSLNKHTLSSNFLKAVSSTVSEKKGFISSSLQKLTIESIQTCFELKAEENNVSELKKGFENIISKNIFQFEKNEDLSLVMRQIFNLYNNEEEIYAIISKSYNKLVGNKNIQNKFVYEVLKSLSDETISKNIPWASKLYLRLKKDMTIRIVEELEKEKVNEKEKSQSTIKAETPKQAKKEKSLSASETKEKKKSEKTVSLPEQSENKKEKVTELNKVEKVDTEAEEKEKKEKKELKEAAKKTNQEKEKPKPKSSKPSLKEKSKKQLVLG